MSEQLMDSWFTALMLPCGIMWTTAYILIIYKGFKDKTYGMPLAAFCANIAWEAIFGLFAPLGSHSTVQTIINIVWLCFDLVILYQILRYGPNEFKNLSKKLFYPIFAVGVAIGFGVVYYLSIVTSDAAGAYAAFGQNMMMSILFMTMLYQRGSARGQMVWIAGLKMVGTLLSSTAFCFFDPSFNQFALNFSSEHFSIDKVFWGNPLMTIFYVGIFGFDLFYFILLILVKKGKIKFGPNAS